MFGYDYGIKPKVMVVGDIEFSEFLHKASISGVGYISIPQSALERQPLKIALLFNNEEYGKKAMRRFNDWIASSNGNEEAFMMDIIEKKDGGYTLCFYQGIECLIERIIPAHIRKWVTPLLANITHFKEIDKVGGYFNSFKKAVKFSKCIIAGGTKYSQFTEIPDIVKNKINIYSEDSIPEHSPIIGYKPLKKEEIEKSRQAFDEVQVGNLDVDREENLKYFFPITYDKILRQNYCKSVIQELTQSYEKNIIVQAICNLTLLHRITKENKLDILKDNYYINILEYLLDNYESVRSSFPNELEISKELIIKQIELDKEVLMKEFSRGGN